MTHFEFTGSDSKHSVQINDLVIVVEPSNAATCYFFGVVDIVKEHLITVKTCIDTEVMQADEAELKRLTELVTYA